MLKTYNKLLEKNFFLLDSIPIYNYYATVKFTYNRYLIQMTMNLNC